MTKPSIAWLYVPHFRFLDGLLMFAPIILRIIKHGGVLPPPHFIPFDFFWLATLLSSWLFIEYYRERILSNYMQASKIDGHVDLNWVLKLAQIECFHNIGGPSKMLVEASDSLLFHLKKNGPGLYSDEFIYSLIKLRDKLSRSPGTDDPRYASFLNYVKGIKR